MDGPDAIEQWHLQYSLLGLPGDASWGCGLFMGTEVPRELDTLVDGTGSSGMCGKVVVWEQINVDRINPGAQHI